MVPFVRMQDIIENSEKKTGYTLLGEEHGCVNGCTCGVSLYTTKEYKMITSHEDQEGFLVLEGKGIAYIGGEELELEPGMCFMIPAHTDHAMKTTPDCEVCKVFWFHGAV